MPIASHSCEAHSMIARIHTTPMSGTELRNIFDKKSVLSSPVRAHHSPRDMPYRPYTNRAITSFPLVRNESTVPGRHHFDEQSSRVEAKWGLRHGRAKC